MTRLFWAAALALALAAPALAQSAPLAPFAKWAALEHLRATAPALGLTAADVAELAVTAGHRSARSGLSYVYVQQRLDGIDVVDGQVTVAVDAHGDVVHTAGALVPGLVGTSAPAVDVAAALRLAAHSVGAPVPPLTPVATGAGPAQETTFAIVAGVPVTARLVYAARPREGVALAWELLVPTPGGDDVWQVRLDAIDGLVFSAADLVVSEHAAPTAGRAVAGVGRRAAAVPLAFVEAAPVAADGASYRVYPAPYESPIHAPTAPPADGRALVVEPAGAASPFGWHDTDGVAGPEYTITWGNNVRAYQDRANDNSGAVSDSPDGGPALSFDFPLDLTLAPSAYTDAAVTNLFYWNSVIHDLTALYGFDEAAGNFQQTNYSGAGAGGDYVRAEAQDGGGTNNANMYTPADGSAPRMQMYEWTTGTPRIDGDFDAGIVVHEYGHGVSNRLTGGPAQAGCLGNAEQMGEGWSDYLGLMLTQQVGDTGPTRRGIGTYALDQPTTGAGIRPAPYSTDLAINPFTYADSQTQAIPHGVGFVWATALWEVTWELIDAFGFDPDLTNLGAEAGNHIALALVMEGMKLQPCSPGFVDGRDAILAADAALYPDPARPGLGRHHDLLWAAFARRGLGVSADQGSSTSNADNVEAFDLPITGGVAAITPPTLAFALGAGEAATADVTLAHTGAPGDGTLTFQAVVTNLSQPDGADALAGGPDLFGYTFADSDEPGGPAVAFTDISATGAPVALTAVPGYDPDDEGYADVALPFAFPFYGAPHGSVRVYSNGFVTFDDTFVGETFTNTAVPGAGIPNAVIAPFWDDLDGGASSVVYAAALPDGRFAIQWDRYGRFNDASTTVTFQLVLSADGTAEIQYDAMAGTLDRATVGIENAAGSDGLGVVFDAPYVTAAKAVLFDAPTAWASVAPVSGDVVPGASAALTVAVDTQDLPDGAYTADLVVTTNDPEAATTTVPVTLTVGGSTATSSVVIAGARGARFLGPPAAGMTVDDLAAQNLVRGVPGYFPDHPKPTLWTGYDTAAGRWLPDGGAGHELPLGRAVRWYLLDRDGVGDPAVSESRALPFTLATGRPVNDRFVRVPLDTGGNRFNHLANPFAEPLDVSGIRSWQGGGGLSRNTGVYTYDPATATWAEATTVAPWQAFRFRARGPRRNGNPRVLTIPSDARVPAEQAARTAAPTPGLRFSLSATAASGRPLRDASLAVVFDAEATAAFDADEDTEKFQPPATAYALVGARVGGALAAVDARPFAPAEVPLAVEARGAAAEMTLSWDAGGLPAGLPVVLVDLATGEEVDVRARSSYGFRLAPSPALDDVPLDDLADPAAAADRFVLRIGAALATTGDVTAVVLEAPVPNPSAGGARLEFGIPEAGAVRLSVFDARGRKVAVLVDGPVAAGRHEAALPAGLAAGVYVVRLEAAGAVVTRRAAVVR
ncbi:M36 family metallopeptidase [Rubrivirga sp. IMCC45206]|uniref:M36 family metallopeptidase n=1 Tax=Rubrivirga sp. IMCC45206 TaxID=3391614 RepID=UPI0039902E09